MCAHPLQATSPPHPATCLDPLCLSWAAASNAKKHDSPLFEMLVRNMRLPRRTRRHLRTAFLIVVFALLAIAAVLRHQEVSRNHYLTVDLLYYRSTLAAGPKDTLAQEDVISTCHSRDFSPHGKTENLRPRTGFHRAQLVRDQTPHTLALCRPLRSSPPPLSPASQNH